MNQLKVNVQESIVTLASHGWSRRRIARELGVDRATVRRHLEAVAAAEVSSSPAISTFGSDGVCGSNAAISISGSAGSPEPNTATISTLGSGGVGDPNAAASTTRSTASPEPNAASDSTLGSATPSGRKSLCEPWRSQIEQALAVGLSAQRIYQDLVREYPFVGSYQAVKRFVRKLATPPPLPFRRIEVEPGAEAQVDFGQGAWVMTPEGQRRRPPLLRVVLSHSRKGYSEALGRQSTEEFIRGLENSFRHFGGVPKSLVIDNLRAAVCRVDWFDPELNPKVREFCQHYGTVILPTRPAMPRHKGKVEAGVKFAQNNALKGRSFESLGAQNLFLAEWERTVADTRIHGTTRQQVGKVFAQVERPVLLPLSPSLFPCFEEARRTVHRDGHVELQKAYYSVPPEYVGRSVWVRWETRLVRIFNHRMEPIAIHARHEPGKFSTDPAHIHDHKRRIIERGVDYLLDRTRLIGRHTGSWAQAMYAVRGVEGIRVLQGVLSLAEKHPVGQLERAAEQALEHGLWRLRQLKELLAHPAPQTQFEFLETHPLIRNLDTYAALCPACFDTAEPHQP